MEFSNINLYKDKIGIYRIVNTQNNHVYVGQTRQNFFRRYLHHQWKLKNGSHDNTYLQNAWNLYGAESFVFEVVECVTNPDVLNDLEIAYIRRYRAIGSCYNLSSGGGGRSGVQLSDEHKQKIGEKNRLNMMGRKATEETKRKMSAARKGKVIRTKNKIPCEQTVDCLHHFSMELLQERHWVEIDLDLEEIRTSQNTYSFTQISLRD